MFRNHSEELREQAAQLASETVILILDNKIQEAESKILTAINLLNSLPALDKNDYHVLQKYLFRLKDICEINSPAEESHRLTALDCENKILAIDKILNMNLSSVARHYLTFSQAQFYTATSLAIPDQESHRHFRAAKEFAENGIKLAPHIEAENKNTFLIDATLLLAKINRKLGLLPFSFDCYLKAKNIGPLNIIQAQDIKNGMQELVMLDADLLMNFADIYLSTEKQTQALQQENRELKLQLNSQSNTQRFFNLSLNQGETPSSGEQKNERQTGMRKPGGMFL